MADDLLYHYTSVEVLRAIVTGNPPSLHLSHVHCMNDFKEHIWLNEVLVNGLRDGVFDTREPFWDYISRHGAGGLYVEVFAMCFSRDPHSSSQWLSYGGEGTGVAIGFDLTANASGGGPQFHDIEYGLIAQQTLLKRLASHSQVQCWFPDYQMAVRQFSEFMHIEAVYCKNPSFEHEKETRLVWNFFPTSLSGMGDYLRSKLRYRTTGAFLVPYVPIEMNPTKKPIAKIMLGPMCPKENEQAIRWMLRQYGFGDVPIQRTTASCRPSR